MDCRFATKCIYGNGKVDDKNGTGAISFPIYQTATYEHPAVGQSTGFDYSRLQNPTRQRVEQIVASLEGGVDALAFSSGMAAITAMMELFRPGDHLITYVKNRQTGLAVCLLLKSRAVNLQGIF